MQTNWSSTPPLPLRPVHLQLLCHLVIISRTANLFEAEVFSNNLFVSSCPSKSRTFCKYDLQAPLCSQELEQKIPKDSPRLPWSTHSCPQFHYTGDSGISSSYLVCFLPLSRQLNFLYHQFGLNLVLTLVNDADRCSS